MKTVDPTIHVGANGHIHKNAVGKPDGGDDDLVTEPIWWKVLLEEAASEIDFVVVHPYPCWRWGGYNYYTKHNDNLTYAVDQACEALDEWASPQDAGRIRVCATEFNAVDWSASPNMGPEDEPGWPWDNDLGHAVVLFELIGQLLLHPRVDMAEVWNTRWLQPYRNEIWNTLDENNDLYPTGRAIAIWGHHIEALMVEASSTETARAFASYDPAEKKLSVFVVNKETAGQEITIELQNYVPAWEGSWSMLHGTGPEDQKPVFEEIQTLPGDGSRLSLALDPVSVSVITLRPR
jgi:hypothetical protein